MEKIRTTNTFLTFLLLFFFSQNIYAQCPDCGNAAGSRICIYDSFGRIVLEKTLTEDSTTINLSTLLMGTYFVQIKDETNNRYFTSPLLIVK